MFKEYEIPNEKVVLPFPDGIELYIKREDLLHAEISGNKFRKLKYNIQEAIHLGKKKLLTFGGAYSNHIAATAAAGRLAGIETLGVIRGEELESKFMDNPTLRKAYADGMRFKFVSRADYRKKNEREFRANLTQEFGDVYVIPEGGTNLLAVKGCEEILKEQDAFFDVICCAVGTGGTISGLINTASEHQAILGFPALKGDFLFEDIRKFATRSNWDLILEYHFGGYGKCDGVLLDFLRDFELKTNIPLDPVYTGKMIYGIITLIGKGFFKPKTKILAIHTGGLQGKNETIMNKL